MNDRYEYIGGVPGPAQSSLASRQQAQNGAQAEPRHCVACETEHVPGFCNLRLMGVQYCGLCGLAHFSVSHVCPSLGSEVQIRLMLDALRDSPEQKDQIELATRVLRNELHNRALRKNNLANGSGS